jgi:hypothetical protein
MIDPNSLVFHNTPPSGNTLPSRVYDAGRPPFTITATACKVDWKLAGRRSSASESSPFSSLKLGNG